MIQIDKKTVPEYAGGCPSQWSFKTKDGKDVYARLRHGYFALYVWCSEEPMTLSQKWNDGLAFDGKPNGFDGIMNTEEMIDYVERSNENIRFI